jgi:hypothetical protein
VQHNHSTIIHNQNTMNHQNIIHHAEKIKETKEASVEEVVEEEDLEEA